MSDNHLNQKRIFTTDEVHVHPLLQSVMKEFAKEVILNNPKNIAKFAREYFERMMHQHKNDDGHH